MSGLETGASAPSSTSGRALCVDFGSTFTKALLVDLTTGEVVGAAEHRTTIDTDVLDGYDACLAALGPAADGAEVLACSSAGGGLRIAVVGNEELVTAEAGRRVALSSGGKVVTVRSVANGDPLDLADAAPDVVLLTGGTDGGNPDPLLAGARGLVEAGWTGPVVVAGNAEVDVSEALAGVPHVVAANVVPQIGVLEPASARAAIREVFLAHVIGGKHLSQRADFTQMVRGATPDVVLTGVELLATVVGEVVVVDVGGATTDVHSVVEVDPELAGLARDVVAPTPVTRTVEGDLGMRWSAVSTVADEPDLAAAAQRRHEDPAFLPDHRGRAGRGRGHRPPRRRHRPAPARRSLQGRGLPGGPRGRALRRRPARGRPGRRLGRCPAPRACRGRRAGARPERRSRR